MLYTKISVFNLYNADFVLPDSEGMIVWEFSCDHDWSEYHNPNREIIEGVRGATGSYCNAEEATVQSDLKIKCYCEEDNCNTPTFATNNVNPMLQGR